MLACTTCVSIAQATFGAVCSVGAIAVPYICYYYKKITRK